MGLRCIKCKPNVIFEGQNNNINPFVECTITDSCTCSVAWAKIMWPPITKTLTRLDIILIPCKDISLTKCSAFSWHVHPFNPTFTSSPNSIKTSNERVAEPRAPLDMTIAWPARVQHTTTRTTKLDQPLSQLIKGCWDAITIKAVSPLTTTSPCTPHSTPDLHLPQKKSSPHIHNFP